MSERRACQVIGQPRSTQRRMLRKPDDEERLTAVIIELATMYGRYGYRRITALLRQAGWLVNKKRVERIWRREGLKVPRKQPKKGRLWLNDGSCIRLRPERANHVWAFDFVQDRTHNGRTFRMLCVVDEFTREALAIKVDRKLGSAQVIESLANLMLERGVPGECPELCVWRPVHAGFGHAHAVKRVSNRIASWLRAAIHSRALRPSFSKLRMAR